MHIAVVGATGQLGADLVDVAREAGHTVTPLGHGEIELTDTQAVAATIAAVAPDAIVNAAAMNHVERCEVEPELAYRINALGPRNLALAASESVALLHVSTDYVFDGVKGRPYVETDLPAPLNAYATAKLAGEHFVASLARRHQVVRTAALYGAHPCRAKPQDNFVRMVLNRAREEGRMRIVRDQYTTPTWTLDLALQLVRLLEAGPTGIFHATCQGSCTWAEFAEAILRAGGLTAQVEPVTSGEFASPVRRPSYSVLDNAHLAALGIDILPDWKNSLERYLVSLNL